MTWKNLLETLIIIKNKSASGDFGFEIFQRVRDILAEIIRTHQNPVNNQQGVLHNGGVNDVNVNDVKKYCMYSFNILSYHYINTLYSIVNIHIKWIYTTI